MSGMLDMLGESAAGAPEAFNGGAPFSDTMEDPDAVLTGGSNGSAGGAGDGGPSDGGTQNGRQAGEAGGRYSKLLPHLINLVTYQSGLDAVEVRVCALVAVAVAFFFFCALILILHSCSCSCSCCRRLRV